MDTISIAVTAIVSAIATAIATSKMKDRSERTNAYKGFLQEIRQNIFLAKHNNEQQYGSARTLFFRDDFWNMSKANGHFLDLPSNLQTLLYEVYTKQYEINEDLNLVGKYMMLNTVQEKIKKELQPKLEEAEKLLEKRLDP